MKAPSKTKHIDDVQPATVDEHFKALLADKDTTIDYESSKDLTPADLPEWYDEELFKAGQRYYSSNLFGFSTAAIAGLIAVLAIPSILKVLIYTKRSGTPCAAFRRHLQAMLHGRVWCTEDSQDSNSDWYKTTNLVRRKHTVVNGRCLRDGLGGITQQDMAFTQFNFIGFVLVQPEYLGLTNTPKEREGANHFWRVVGHMIGIPDRLNICRKTEAETTLLCEKLKDQVFAKYLKEMPPNFMEMTEILLEGLWSMDVTIDADAVLAMTYKLTGLSYHKPLGLYSWLNLKYRETIHKLCGTPYIGSVVRGFFNYFISFNYSMLKDWPVVAWLKYGMKQTKIHLYPKLK